MSKNNFEDTIVAISTPVGEGGIGIVRLSGPKALEITGEMFVSRDGKAAPQLKTYTIHYGHIVNKANLVDEVIVTVMKAPRSYTKEDVVEINCHGGIQALKSVLELAVKRGARIAEPGEFTKRAFLNGRIDLAQAEAVLDMIRAKTEGSLRAAAGQLEGGLSKKVNQLREKILDIAAHVEASIDFPEEDTGIIGEAGIAGRIDGILSDLKYLLETADEGIILREGILAVIVGKPNAGKSSLMNLLLKRDRVIVTPVPGTTRDAVEEMICLKGIPIRLVDTAGIADTEDIVGKEGMKRSKKYLDNSDIALVLFDGSSPIDEADMGIIRLVDKKKKIAVINKTDLPGRLAKKELKESFEDGTIVEISVREKKNIEALEKAIADMIWSGKIDHGEGALITNVRHKALVAKALENISEVKRGLQKEAAPELISIDLKEAVFNLGLVIGKSVSDDILDRIFEEFCIGK